MTSHIVQTLERPTKRRKVTGIKGRSNNPAHDKTWDRTMARAMACLDADDFAGFWHQIDRLNAINTLRG